MLYYLDTNIVIYADAAATAWLEQQLKSSRQ